MPAVTGSGTPWAEVHAGPVRRRPHPRRPRGAIGLVGEPTVEFVAAIFGTWFADRSLSILPGPVRGADVDHWARSTLTRFTEIGVGTVFTHGPTLKPLPGQCFPGSTPAVHDVRAVAQPAATRPCRLRAPCPAVLQGTAGSTGSPGPRC